MRRSDAIGAGVKCRAVAALVTCVVLAGCGPSKEERVLAALLDDRTPGPPVACLDLTKVDAVHVVAHRIVYESKVGDIFYVNRPIVGADSLRLGATLLSGYGHGRVCQDEAVQVLAAGETRPHFNKVVFAFFTPYRRRTD